ncbi:MAG: hypothetical protein AB1560_00250 [Pseudomonadota bacterium]
MLTIISEFFAFFLTPFLIAISIVTGTEQRDAVCRMVPAAEESA